MNWVFLLRFQETTMSRNSGNSGASGSSGVDAWTVLQLLDERDERKKGVWAGSKANVGRNCEPKWRRTSFTKQSTVGAAYAT